MSGGADPSVQDGGCLCGAVRYRVSIPEPVSTVHCHCTICRRVSGAPVTTWVTVPRGAFTVTKGTPRRYKSSDHGDRQFCPACGAQLTFRTRHHPDFVDVTVGTLDHPARVPPARHIWLEDKIAWLHLDEDLPGEARESGSDGGASG